jgi:hypothetical protein
VRAKLSNLQKNLAITAAADQKYLALLANEGVVVKTFFLRTV